MINGTIIINSCSDNCNVCQAKLDRCEYFDCRWQENEDRYIFVKCTEKRWNLETFVMFVFVEDRKRKKNLMKHIQVARIAENSRAQDLMTKRQNSQIVVQK